MDIPGNLNNFDRYQAYIKAQQDAAREQQAADPEWQQWQQIASSYTPDMGGAPASPTSDYYGQWLQQQSPEVQRDYASVQNDVRRDDKRSLTGRLGQLAPLIPLAVGVAGMAGAAGLLGGAEAAGGSALGGGGIGGAESAAFADLASGLLPDYGSNAAYAAGLGDAASWAAAPSLGGVANPGYAAPPGLLDQLVDKAPELLNQGGALLGGGGSGGLGGKGLDLGGLQFGRYTAPGMPALAPFKASTGLAEFARTLGQQRKPRGLMGF